MISLVFGILYSIFHPDEILAYLRLIIYSLPLLTLEFYAAE
jgi:hypothetical protein